MGFQFERHVDRNDKAHVPSNKILLTASIDCMQENIKINPHFQTFMVVRTGEKTAETIHMRPVTESNSRCDTIA